jgi:hypothetical protein
MRTAKPSSAAGKDSTGGVKAASWTAHHESSGTDEAFLKNDFSNT